jgi:hypothetical protein
MYEMLEAIHPEFTKHPPIMEVEAFFKLQKNRCMNTQK